MFGGRRAVHRPSPDPSSPLQGIETIAKTEGTNGEVKGDSKTLTEATDTVLPPEQKSDEVPAPPTRQPPTVPSTETSTSTSPSITVKVVAETNETIVNAGITQPTTDMAAQAVVENTTEATADAAMHKAMETIEETKAEAVTEETASERNIEAAAKAGAEETALEKNTESPAEATPEVVPEAGTIDVTTETTTESTRQPAPATMPTETPAAPAPTAVVTTTTPLAEDTNSAGTSDTTVDGTPQTIQRTARTPSIHVLPADVERDSQKVRSLYESGDLLRWEDGGRLSPLGEYGEPDALSPNQEAGNDAYDYPP